MNVTAPTMAAPMQAAMASARQMAGRRSNFTGMSGADTRRSCRSSSTRDSTATTTNAKMPGSAATEMRCACSSASSSGTTNPVNSTSPSQSNRTRDTPPTWSGRRTASTAATAPSGTLMRNTDVQPKCCVSHPPATGPKVDDTMKMEAR